MDNTNLIETYNEKLASDKKHIKKLSNIISVPLILMQLFATLAALVSALAAMLLRVVLTMDTKNFSLKSFLYFISQTDNSNVVNNIFYGMTYFAYMFISFILIVLLLKQNPFKIIPFKIKHIELLPLAVTVGLLFSIAGEFYSEYFQSILSFLHLKVQLDEFSFPHNVPALIIYVIQISLLAPFCEEFIFRGIILQNLRIYGDLFAVIVSSILFGMLHGNFAQTPFAFAVGAALAFAVIETGSIWVSILIHCIINSFSVFLTGISYYYSGSLTNTIYSIYTCAVVVLTIIAVILLYKKNYFKGILDRYSQPHTLLSPSIAASNFVKTPGCIVFIAVYLISMFSRLTM